MSKYDEEDQAYLDAHPFWGGSNVSNVVVNRDLNDFETACLQQILSTIEQLPSGKEREFFGYYMRQKFDKRSTAKLSKDFDHFIGLPANLKNPDTHSSEVAAFYKQTFKKEINAVREKPGSVSYNDRWMQYYGERAVLEEGTLSWLNTDEGKSIKSMINGIKKLASMSMAERKMFWLKQKLKSLYRSKLRREALMLTAGDASQDPESMASFQNRWGMSNRWYGEMPGKMYNDSMSGPLEKWRGRDYYQAKKAERMNRRKSRFTPKQFGAINKGQLGSYYNRKDLAKTKIANLKKILDEQM